MSDEQVLLGLALTTTVITGTFLLAKRRKEESARSAAELLIPPALTTFNNVASEMSPPHELRSLSPRPLRRSFSDGEPATAPRDQLADHWL